MPGTANQRIIPTVVYQQQSRSTSASARFRPVFRSPFFNFSNKLWNYYCFLSILFLSKIIHYPIPYPLHYRLSPLQLLLWHLLLLLLVLLHHPALVYAIVLQHDVRHLMRILRLLLFHHSPPLLLLLLLYPLSLFHQPLFSVFLTLHLWRLFCCFFLFNFLSFGLLFDLLFFLFLLIFGLRVFFNIFVNSFEGRQIRFLSSPSDRVELFVPVHSWFWFKVFLFLILFFLFLLWLLYLFLCLFFRLWLLPLDIFNLLPCSFEF